VTSITDPEISAFLAAGTRTAKLAYAGMDGRPLVTPVWFAVEDGCIIFSTFRKSAKARALARDPRVTLCTDLEEPPYAFVQVQGEAELSEDPGELLRIATMIAARYMGPDRTEEFGKRNGVPGELIVRLRPGKVLAGFNLTGRVAPPSWRAWPFAADDLVRGASRSRTSATPSAISRPT
jgi:PPOX class probable F420-dependent enzyme